MPHELSFGEAAKQPHKNKNKNTVINTETHTHKHTALHHYYFLLYLSTSIIRQFSINELMVFKRKRHTTHQSLQKECEAKEQRTTKRRVNNDEWNEVDFYFYCCVLAWKIINERTFKTDCRGRLNFFFPVFSLLFLSSNKQA